MLTIILAIIVGGLIYYKIVNYSNNWIKAGIPYVSTWTTLQNVFSIIFMKKHVYEISNEIYNKYPNARYVGMSFLGSNSLLVRDIDLIKQMGIKDFESFVDHGATEANKLDPLLSKSLVSLQGEEWKQMRSTLSPAFTSSKMKNMYTFMAECAENFCSQFQEKERIEVEMKELFRKFAGDVIASTAFGIPLDHTKDPDNEFYTKTETLLKSSFLQMMKGIMIHMCPKLAKWLDIQILPRDVSTFFTSVITSNMDRRIKETIIRPDLIHLLLEARKGVLKHDQEEEKEEGFAIVAESQIGKVSKQIELTDTHIVAQALLFFFAGFETISSATTFMAYELAVHPDVQNKLQKEINAVHQKYGDKVPYDVLLSMKYLDQVLSETLRLWPPGFQTDRNCNKDYVIEAVNQNEKRFVVEKKTMVVIPIMSLHRDPKYFPDPERFDPERFSDENKSKIVPGSYLPFGIGPRNCIGSRFALLEAKILFFHLLSKFEILTTEKTQIPMEIDPSQFSFQPKNGFQLALKRRE